MYLNQSQQLKHLSKKEYIALKELCKLAKNLYNVGLYNVRQHYFNTKKYLNYTQNYPLAKANENYKMLNSNMSQQILKEVDGSFKSFFGLIAKAKAGNYDFKDIKIPKYLDKEGYFTLVIGQIRIKDNGILDVPMSPNFKKVYGKVSIKVPSNLQGKTIKEIRILPKFNARFFEIQYTHEVAEEPKELDKTHVLAIDLGVNNLATCVTNKGKCFIVDGKKLKSINQWYNKRLSRLQSIKDKQFGVKNKIVTKQQAIITKKKITK